MVDENGWGFPSENLTSLSKDNCWHRSMHAKLDKPGLGWVNSW